MLHLWIQLILVVVSLCEECPEEYHTLLSANFNRESRDKLFTREMIALDFNSNVEMWSSKGGTVRVGRGMNGSLGLTVKYPAGVYRSQEIESFKIKFTPSIDVYMSYDVKFESGFVFVKGGKLPGICGGTCNTGGWVPNGNDGFSNRFMWRPEGKIVNYIYHVGQSGKYGDDVDTGIAFTPGEWHQLASRVRLNEIGKSNGLLETWIDGNKVNFPSEYENMVWRLSSTILIDTFYFSSFFGGHTPEWAPARDVEASFDNFLICGHDTINSNNSSSVRHADFKSKQIVKNRLQSDGEPTFGVGFIIILLILVIFGLNFMHHFHLLRIRIPRFTTMQLPLRNNRNVNQS